MNSELSRKIEQLHDSVHEILADGDFVEYRRHNTAKILQEIEEFEMFLDGHLKDRLESVKVFVALDTKSGSVTTACTAPVNMTLVKYNRPKKGLLKLEKIIPVCLSSQDFLMHVQDVLAEEIQSGNVDMTELVKI